MSWKVKVVDRYKYLWPQNWQQFRQGSGKKIFREIIEVEIFSELAEFEWGGTKFFRKFPAKTGFKFLASTLLAPLSCAVRAKQRLLRNFPSPLPNRNKSENKKRGSEDSKNQRPAGSCGLRHGRVDTYFLCFHISPSFLPSNLDSRPSNFVGMIDDVFWFDEIFNFLPKIHHMDIFCSLQK